MGTQNMKQVKIYIFADYACPFVFNAYMWLSKIKNHYGDNLNIKWKSFLLDTKDVNFDWKNPETLSSNRSLMSLIAAKAAKRQGEDLFQRYHDKLLISRNSQIKRIRLNDKPTLIRLANECDLDLNQFEVDLNSEQIIDEVSSDHNEAVNKFGIFGTPTFVFENGNSIYLKTFIPTEQNAIKSFEHFLSISKDCSFIGEMKRPQPPWPSGYDV